MADDTQKVWVWADNSFVVEDDLEDGDLDLYIMFTGKSDDCAQYDVPLGLDAEDIEELIILEALPGMLKPTQTLEGEINLPKDSVLIIKCPTGDAFVTQTKSKIIISGTPQMSIEVLKGK